MIRGLLLGIAGVIVLAVATPDGVFNFLDLLGWALLAVGAVVLSTVRLRPRHMRR